LEVVMRGSLLVPLVVLMAACSGDGDGDGLSGADEKYWGTDPKVADSDGDGLADGDEVELGTHPAYADTDGDGMVDGEEITFGLDPNDPDSKPYEGGWPMLTPGEKDALQDANGPFPGAEVDKGFKRWKLVDQFGDRVDLYDFAKSGRTIIVDVSAEWCGPCNAMAEWLESDDDQSFNGLTPAVRDAVNNGDVIWLTVLGQDNSYAPASAQTVKSWYREYKNPNVPVLAAGESFVEYIDLGFWPTMFTLDENMVMTSYDDYAAVVDACD